MSAGALLTRGQAGGRIYQRMRGNRAAFTGLPEPPPAGYQYETCSSATWTGTSLSQSASPAVAVGDVFIGALLSSPNNDSVTINGDGTLDLNTGGSTSRQLVPYGIFRVSTNAIDPTNFPISTGLFWVNEVAPAWATVIVLSQNIGTSLSLNLASPTYATSPSGDTLVFMLLSGSLPPGLALNSNGTLSGTPTSIGVFSFVIGATDLASVTTPSAPGQITIISTVIVQQSSTFYLDIYDNLNGSFNIAWGAPSPLPSSYNVYVNGILNQSVTSPSARVSGLTVESYNRGAIAASTGNSLRPQNMPPVGVVTPSGTYDIHVTAVISGVEVARTARRQVTVNPTSIMLTTPMKRPFPYPNTGSPNG